jgi:hypothetical protein
MAQSPEGAEQGRREFPMKSIAGLLALTLAACAAPTTILQNNQGQIVTCSAAGIGVLGTVTALVAHGNCVDTYKAAGFHEPGAAVVAAQPSGPSTAISKDGSIQLLLPAGWTQLEPPATPTQQPSPAFLIYARNPVLEGYLVVSSDDKRDIGDLSAYGIAVGNRLVSSLTDTQVSQIQTFTLNDHRAMRFDASGVINGVRLHYLSTIVETPTKMLKLTAWTLESKFADRRDGLAMLASGLAEATRSTIVGAR